MVLAAGRGERLRPLTDSRPKPLVEVGGRALIDHVLDRLDEAGVETAVVNLHYRGDQIERHLLGRRCPAIHFSRETEPLETGGGVAKALPLLGAVPFFIANGDVFLLNGRVPALRRVADAWNDRTMDALLLMHAASSAFGYEGQGDYFLSPAGVLRRRRDREIAPFVYAGVLLVHPRLFEGAPAGRFSLNVLFDRAQAAGRLYGIRHDGVWFHVGTMEALAETESWLRSRESWADTRASEA